MSLGPGLTLAHNRIVGKLGAGERCVIMNPVDQV